MISRPPTHPALVALATLFLAGAPGDAADRSATDDPLAPWTKGVRPRPVAATPGRHTLHSYYLASPESPDGRGVLFFSSTHPAAHLGEIRVLDRATGRETVLAENVQTEDAHRAACQQWLSNGRRVAFHEVAEKRWRVVVVELATGARTIVAQDRQLAFGQPHGDLLPLYGCHWNPGRHRDLEILDAATGSLRTALAIGAVQERHRDWIGKEFGDRPVSIFFPILSPDLKRVFFKIAAGRGGDDFMAKDASHRQGLVCHDLERREFTWMRAKWGHPAWHPDSKRIIEMGNLIFDTDTGAQSRIPDVPNLRGSHPSFSPDGRLFVTDGYSEAAGGRAGEWGVMVGDVRGGRFALLHSFDQSRGARSWRRSHPHPVFSADGRRIYYNVSDGEFTRLHVAEIAPAPP